MEPLKINIVAVEAQKVGARLKLPEKSAEIEMRRTCCERFLGMAIMTVASMLLSLSIAVVKALEGYHVFNISLWIFIGGCFLPSIPVLIFYTCVIKSHPLKVLYPFSQRRALKTWCLLFIRGAAGSTAFILQIKSLDYLSMSDTTVICLSTPVFVTFLACLLLGETCGFIDILAALITLIGVSVITRPPFLTGEAHMDSNNMIGVGLALASMTSLTFVILSLRLLKDVHFALVTLSFGTLGTIVCVIAIVLFETLEIPRSSWDWFLAAMANVCIFSGQVALSVAFKYEDAGPLALIRSFDVIFAFIWQAIFFLVMPDMYSIIGSFIVLAGVVLVGIRKHVSSLPKEHPCRVYCCWILR